MVGFRGVDRVVKENERAIAVAGVIVHEQVVVSVSERIALEYELVVQEAGDRHVWGMEKVCDRFCPAVEVERKPGVLPRQPNVVREDTENVDLRSAEIDRYTGRRVIAERGPIMPRPIISKRPVGLCAAVQASFGGNCGYPGITRRSHVTRKTAGALIAQCVIDGVVDLECGSQGKPGEKRNEVHRWGGKALNPLPTGINVPRVLILVPALSWIPELCERL